MRIRSFSSRSSWNPNFFPKNNEDSEVYNDFQPLQTNESVRISREKASNQEESKTVQNRTDSTNPHGSPVFIWILASEPWLETRIKAFKPRFLCFWVDSSKLGLGFKNTRERLEKRREERERYEPNEWTGLIALLYMCLGRVDPKPDPLSSVPSRLIRILMDPDQSNAPGALVWSVPIRSVGFWA